MRTDQKVGHDSSLPAASLEVGPKMLAGEFRALERRWHKFDLPILEKGVELIGIRERRADFRQHAFASHELTFRRGRAQQRFRRVCKSLIVRDDIKNYGAVNG